MSPYQQDVINETLTEFDVQAQKGIPSIAAQAVKQVLLGGGREGVHEIRVSSNKRQEPSSITSTVITTRFWSSSNAAQQAFMNQQALANQQLGILGLGQQQAFLGQDIGALSTLGAQNQALLTSAIRSTTTVSSTTITTTLNSCTAYGQGVTSLIAGYPGQTQTTTMPSPNPLATAIGAGGTLAGIYRAFNQPGVLNS